MEMCSGFECTLNRIGDRYQGQHLLQECEKCTAYLRALPGLGVSPFRYLVAWDDVSTPRQWALEDLTFLAAHNITAIVGLLHHGSGPKNTSLRPTQSFSALADANNLFAARV